MNLVHSQILLINLVNRNDGQGHHWSRTQRAKNELGVALSHLKRTPFETRVDVVMTRLLGPKQRFFDPDSVGRGNAKQIVDTLTSLGWWHDDSTKHIRNFDYRQDGDHRDNGPAVLIEVYEVKEVEA